MTTLITDPRVEEQLIAERQAVDADRLDEVWEGVYFMPPMANDEHQALASGIGAVAHFVVYWPGLGEVRVGVNVSDRVKLWKQNYRVPDVAVFLKGGGARNYGTHWCGGPDFLSEILSPRDRAREKLPFYEKLKVREVLLVDRKPWTLELYRLVDGKLRLLGKSTVKKPVVLASTVLPLRFRLVPGTARPMIEVTHTDGAQRWLV